MGRVSPPTQQPLAAQRPRACLLSTQYPCRKASGTATQLPCPPGSGTITRQGLQDQRPLCGGTAERGFCAGTQRRKGQPPAPHSVCDGLLPLLRVSESPVTSLGFQNGWYQKGLHTVEVGSVANPRGCPLSEFVWRVFSFLLVWNYEAV